jgi:hypothetical protein
VSQWPAQPPHAELPIAPVAYATVQRPRLERNRRGGLIAFGIVSILIGALAGFLAAFTSFVLTMVMVHGKIPLWPMFAAVPVFAVAATLFIWVGMGSIRHKRWVRPVVISFAWPTLIVMSLAGWLLYTEEFARISGPLPREVSFVRTLMFVLISLFGVVIPAAFVWFYSTAAVRRTLAAYDPGPSWTGRYPLPLFVGSVNFALGGLMTLSLATVGSAPFFGRYVEGAPAAGLVVAAAVALFAAAVLFYRVHLLGWILALAVIVLGFVSAMLTMGELGAYEFYRRGGGPRNLHLWDFQLMTGPAPLVFVGTLFAICLLYLLWARQWFVARPVGTPPTPEAA